MKAFAISIAVIAAAGCISLATSAQACFNCGIKFNGTQANGINFNGPCLNGCFQGAEHNGVAANGPLLQGPVLQGPVLQGPSAQGARDAQAPVSPRIEVRTITLANGRKVKVR